MFGDECTHVHTRAHLEESEPQSPTQEQTGSCFQGYQCYAAATDATLLDGREEPELRDDGQTALSAQLGSARLSSARMEPSCWQGMSSPSWMLRPWRHQVSISTCPMSRDQRQAQASHSPPNLQGRLPLIWDICRERKSQSWQSLSSAVYLFLS